MCAPRRLGYASPRPTPPNCHRGSKPRRRPELRRGVTRRLGMARPRPRLGKREPRRGLARPAAFAPHPSGRAAMLRGSHRVVGPCGGRPPGGVVGVWFVVTGLGDTVGVSVTLGGEVMF